MLLGINAFAEAPFSATNLDLGNVKVVVTGNQLTISIGNVEYCRNIISLNLLMVMI